MLMENPLLQLISYNIEARLEQREKKETQKWAHPWKSVA